MLQAIPVIEQRENIQTKLPRGDPRLRIGAVDHPQRHLRLERTRECSHCQFLALRPREGDALPLPEVTQRLDLVKGVFPPVLVVLGVEDEVALVPSGGQAHAGAAAGELVDQSPVLDHARGVVVRQDDAPCPQRDATGHAAQAGAEDGRIRVTPPKFLEMSFRRPQCVITSVIRMLGNSEKKLITLLAGNVVIG